VSDLSLFLADVDQARLVDRFGSGAEAWCTGLPGLVDAVTQAWRLRVAALMPAGANSVVLSCRSDDGEQVVLKLTPDVTIAAQEATALQAWSACRHVVALLDHDVERGALLLESVRPGVKLSGDPGGWSLDDVAPMFAELWRPGLIGPDSGFPELSERVDVVFDLARRRLGRWPAVNARIGQGVVERSLARSRELAVQGPVGLVHGDLHPGNVLRAGDRGVVAIDPRPCSGDQATDAVDWMLSDVTDEQGLEKRIDWLALNVPGVDPARVWAWCQAMAVIVAASMLARREDDPVGEFLLRFASAPR
jgi:streptomycin 6-kinase